MAKGIDIYRYQTVTNWNAVKGSGVAWVYVKGSDGGGPAMVRADNQVRGAKSIGLPVGLYHYAQLSPSPEAQADVAIAEARRLNALDLPIALDLEDPHRPGSFARDFSIRFINRVRAQGLRVILYANTSMLIGIQAQTIDVDVWEANYGPNDGKRHELPARPWRRKVHQYTSVGKVAGITGNVDINESFVDITQEVDDLSWNDPSGVLDKDGKPYSFGVLLEWTNRFVNEFRATTLPGIQANIAELKDTVTAPVVDLDALADKVAARLAATLGRATVDALRDELND